MSSPRQPQLWDIVAEEWPTTPHEYEIETAEQLEKLLKELKITEGATVLEVAAGTGYVSAYLAGKGYKTTVTDFSEGMVKKAKEYYEKNGLEGNFTVLDMFKMSKETVGMHDVVFIMHVFDHYDGWEVLQVLEKMKGISQKYVIVLSQNPKCNPYLLFHRAAMGKGEWRWGLSVLRNSLKELAQLAGLEVIDERFFAANSLSKWMANYVSPETGELYADSIDLGLIPDDQKHFRVMVAKESKKEFSAEEKVALLETAFRLEQEALRKTYYFDTNALKSKIEQLRAEVKTKSDTIRDLESKLLTSANK